MAAAVAMETDDAGNRLRFQLELEFVQCLANPNYLNFLAQRGYFKDKAFVNYLKYLLYWKEPEYAKYLNLVELLEAGHIHLLAGGHGYSPESGVEGALESCRLKAEPK
ncbi:mediator complex subunit 31 [Cricetulus griseus]